MFNKPFILHSEYAPAGDQPMAIEALSRGVLEGKERQTLLGVTGSGKTFTLANMIARVNRPVLVVSHNKTLAAQLYSEFKSFFPENAVEYFVSYYDYYQPEAYIPQTDTYIAKDASINDSLERLRLAATGSLLERRDTIVVCSVSCLYGLGSPEDFEDMSAHIKIGDNYPRKDFLTRLVTMQYVRNDIGPERGNFRVAGDTLDVYPSTSEDFLRIDYWGDEVDRISRCDPVTRQPVEELQEATILPAKHFVMPEDRIKAAYPNIIAEMEEQVRFFESRGKLIEAQRIYERTRYDMEMLLEVGYCQGIENYSRHLAGRPAGSRPFTIVDYFPKDFLTIIDESHVTLPQIHAMQTADRNRKVVLVENGFRLPSAIDNRPLTYDEFASLQHQVVFCSATPGTYELSITTPVEQVVRPTGLLDPEVEIRPLADQVDDVIAEIRDRAEKGQRTLVTTLTKRMAEDLSDYLRKLDVRSRYLHSEMDAMERVDVLRSLRSGEFDVLVGINLLREGLDLPEVSLVAVMDADKEGFLRSARSLIQTAGRAARNAEGKVILYADNVTDSIQEMVDLTRARRERQMAYNREHGITPKTVQRAIQQSLRVYEEAEREVAMAVGEDLKEYDILEIQRQLEAEMHAAAENLEFERAAELRDQIRALQDGKSNAFGQNAGSGKKPVRKKGVTHNVGKKSFRNGHF
ncbi:MAG: excinuclease ABC subunit UvrB [Victivallales bacterium]|nr:excinuclease ABC subunit UvrB [Victivallales bacterium]